MMMCCRSSGSGARGCSISASGSTSSSPSPTATPSSGPSRQLGGAIYQLSCLCPDDQRRLYIGQTGVPLSKRMEWHERDWKHNRGSFSGHRAGYGHSVQFDEVQIVSSVENYRVRVVLEALQILRLSQSGASLIHNPNLDGRDGHRINKSDGLRLSPLWGPIAKKI